MVRKKQIIVGIDEVGRGPLAGAVVVGGVALVNLPRQRGRLTRIKDSKKLSKEKREEWERKIKSKKSNLKTAVSFVGNGVIDKKGIVKAIEIAVERTIKKLEKEIKINPRNCLILLDGSLKAPKHYNQKTIIKGDEKIPVISAASVIAKVARDRKMTNLPKKFAKYGFEKHKGYGTKLHYKMLKKHGISKIHRRSYLPARLAMPVRALRARKNLRGVAKKCK